MSAISSCSRSISSAMCGDAIDQAVNGRGCGLAGHDERGLACISGIKDIAVTPPSSVDEAEFAGGWR